MREKEPTQVTQLELFRHGGARPGAGRKRLADRALVPHRKRAHVTRHEPVLVTTRLCPMLPSLRDERIVATLRDAFAKGAERPGFRLVEYSVQSNHIHLLVEVASTRSLTRGMRGLHVCIARVLNRTWKRRGAVFVGRYHARVLKSPREVRHALVYVLQNVRKHMDRITSIDEYSSGPWFEHWLDHESRARHSLPRPESWLLTTGWLRHGRIASHEVPVASGARGNPRGPHRTAGAGPNAMDSGNCLEE